MLTFNQEKLQQLDFVKNKLKDKLDKRIEEGTYRSLSSFSGIDFWSNDYLGLSKMNFQSQDMNSFGSTGSRLISGNSAQAEECERIVSSFFLSEAALIYNSGYDANIGFFSCIPQKGDLIIYDSEIHASVRDGVRLSFAKSVSFNHNSLVDLEKKLKLGGDQIYVAIESLYSMGGDFAPIVQILNVCEKYNAHLIVDEAHSAGVFGENGKGLVQAFGIENRVFARLITFGKAYGSHGAAILSSEVVIHYLVNFSRSFIYTTALPSESYARIISVIENDKLESERQKLIHTIQLFREQLADSNFNLISEINSPIQMIEIGNVLQSKVLAQKCRDNSILVKEILSPTVQVGKEGIRICIHSFNTSEQINYLVQLILK